MVFAGVNLHGLHWDFKAGPLPIQVRKVKIFGKYMNNNGVVKQITDDSQFSGWWGNDNSRKEDLKALYIYLSDADIL